MKKKIGLILAILLLLLFSLTGCGAPAIVDYEEGNCTFSQSEVESVSVQMNLGKDSGTVYFCYGEQDKITVTGESNDESEYLLRYALKNKTLYIREAKIEEEREPSFRQYIRITFPKGMQLKNINFKSVSAVVEMDGITADKITVESNGGGTKINGVTCRQLYAKSYTASMRIHATVSEHIDTYTTYATTYLTLPSLPNSTVCYTKYGGVDITLPTDSENFVVFTGKRTFETDFEFEKVTYTEGDTEKDKYICGIEDKEIHLTLWLKSCTASIKKQTEN